MHSDPDANPVNPIPAVVVLLFLGIAAAELVLTGMVASLDGQRLIRDEARGPQHAAAWHGALARLASFGARRTRLILLSALVLGIVGAAGLPKLRVELSVDPGTSAAVPLQHGLPGSVEVQVETVTAARYPVLASATPPKRVAVRRERTEITGRVYG